MPEAGKSEITGNLLLFSDPDGAGIAQWDTETSGIREYFQKKQDERKNKQQALICIARRLVNIVYGMLKNHTEYREPERRTEEETV